uniref:Cytosolic phospholipase A2-like n=1 Tax=Phallusia mammillata TaxID=59560 RepID=A0A6F9DPL1_9ASCI|nr:cytosolic phospholipase A2-like [Phallusia mammillata]
MGHRTKQAIDTEEEEISICDAGIVKNVSVECMLRDSRRSDLIIVFDMNHYLNDEYFDYMPILQSAEHAWRDGLPFPPINVKELVNSPPKEFLVFESDSDDCPTVLWFTLCNKSFKNLKNYKPKRPFDASKNDGRPFNDFPVFSKDGNYSTYKFNNTGLQFDQLHQLMYHNVTSHIEDIKKHIAQAVERRKMRLQNGNA